MKKWILATSALVAVFGAQAALIIGGDFSGDVHGATPNTFTAANVDAGWTVKAWNWGTGNTIPGSFTDEEATAPANGYGLTQVNSITSESGTVLNFGFDWTAATGATGDGLVLSYQLIGWKTTGSTAASGSGSSTVDDTDIFFVGLNGSQDGRIRSINTTNTDVDYGSWVDFVDGDTGSSKWMSSPGWNTFTGVADSTETASLTLDLTEMGLGDLSDYDYIGIQFSTDATGAGGVLDNITLTASIPEPATIGLLGLGAAGLIALRRRCK